MSIRHIAAAEAADRYQGDVEPESGERFDDWGYSECERRAFVAGAVWATEERLP